MVRVYFSFAPLVKYEVYFSLLLIFSFSLQLPISVFNIYFIILFFLVSIIKITQEFSHFCFLILSHPTEEE